LPGKQTPKKGTEVTSAQAAAEAAPVVGRLREALAGETEPGAEELAALAGEVVALPPATSAAALAQVARDAQARAVPLLAAVAARADGGRLAGAIAALALVRQPAAAEALKRIAEGTQSKAIRKEARAALFRLHAAGVPVPAVERVEPPRPRGQVVVAKVSNVDGVGSWLVALAREVGFGTATLLVAVLNDERGMVDAYGGNMGRTEVDRRLESLVQHMPAVHLVDAPADYVRQAMEEAHERNRVAGQPVPREFYRWRADIGQPARRYERELVYDEIDPAAVRWNPQLLDQSAALLDVPEFLGWLLPEDAAREAAVTLSRAREARIVLPGRSQEEQELRATDRFVENFFDAPTRLKYKVRLERTAYVLLRLGRTLEARVAVAAALALDPSSPTPLSRQPFPLAMARKTLAALEAEAQQRRELRTGLYLPPR